VLTAIDHLADSHVGEQHCHHKRKPHGTHCRSARDHVQQQQQVAGPPVQKVPDAGHVLRQPAAAACPTCHPCLQAGYVEGHQVCKVAVEWCEPRQAWPLLSLTQGGVLQAAHAATTAPLNSAAGHEACKAAVEWCQPCETRPLLSLAQGGVLQAVTVQQEQQQTKKQQRSSESAVFSAQAGVGARSSGSSRSTCQSTVAGG
jgi:hypothetical protein